MVLPSGRAGVCGGRVGLGGDDAGPPHREPAILRRATRAVGARDGGQTGGRGGRGPWPLEGGRTGLAGPSTSPVCSPTAARCSGRSPASTAVSRFLAVRRSATCTSRSFG